MLRTDVGRCTHLLSVPKVYERDDSLFVQQGLFTNHTLHMTADRKTGRWRREAVEPVKLEA